jgi:hypothetical protein
MVVTVIEVRETGVGVDVGPGDEIVLAEGTVVDYPMGGNGELNCISEAYKREDSEQD